MKIGVITVNDVYTNYGCFLQMYSLKRCLEKMGHDVYEIKLPKEDSYFYRAIRCYKRDYLLKENFIFLRKIWRLYRILEKYITLFKGNILYQKKYCRGISFITVDEAQECDVIIIGSDEVWNINNPAAGSPFYWGNSFKGKNKIAYAVCCGDTDLELCQKNIYPVQLIKDIKFLSARDLITKTLITQLTGAREVPIVTDPTFLIDLNELEQEDIVIGKKYMVVYAWSVEGTLRENIVRFARENSLLIVCPMDLRKYDFVDINIKVSPLAFSNVIKKAEYVYADTFHGTVFSILNKKKAVYSVLTHKVRWLLDEYGMTDRIIDKNTNYDCFNNRLTSNIDVDFVDKKIKLNREASLNFIVDSLEQIKGEL